jgi:hypothetical protein
MYESTFCATQGVGLEPYGMQAEIKHLDQSDQGIYQAY